MGLFSDIIGFQFHKGTIKAILLFQKTVILLHFQFHKGTIKAWFFEVRTDDYYTFNSIKVQLRL